MVAISVLVPVYNVEDYLNECLKSIAEQTMNDYEVIIVNDGSTDKSLEICESFKKHDSRIQIISQENRGLAGARNTAIRAAKGEYVAFVDSDDKLLPNYLEELYSLAMRESADVVACGRSLYYSEDRVTEIKRPGFANKRMTNLQAIRALNSYRSFDMSMWGKLFRHTLFEGIEFPERKLSEDQFVCYKLLDKAKNTFYTEECLYLYRQREGSISRGSKVNEFPIEAAVEQRQYLMANHPQLKRVADTACVFSGVAVYNAYIRRGILPDISLKKIINQELHESLFSVIFNHDLSIKKKIQAIVFRYSKPVYHFIYSSNRKEN